MIVDLYLVYQFIKRLATKFETWEAYKTGVIDAEGNIITPKKDRTPEQRKSFGKYDLMILKLKKLLAKVPGGNTRLGTYAAALWLIKEHNDNPTEQQLVEYMDHIKENQDVNKRFETLFEEGIVNTAGSGNIHGIGVGPKGEPGVTPAKMKKYKKKNQEEAPKRRVSFKDMI